MSQFDLTPEESAMVLDAVRFKAGYYTAVYGVADPVLEALVAKMSPVEAPAEVEQVPAAEVEQVPVDPVAKTATKTAAKTAAKPAAAE
jgi:hypothetical protein